MKSNCSIVMPKVKLLHKSFICLFRILSQHPTGPTYACNRPRILRQETTRHLVSLSCWSRLAGPQDITHSELQPIKFLCIRELEMKQIYMHQLKLNPVYVHNNENKWSMERIDLQPAYL